MNIQVKKETCQILIDKMKVVDAEANRDDKKIQYIHYEHATENV